MTRAGVQVRLGVVVRALVLVANEEADGCAERDAVLDSGLDRNLVVLVSLSMAEASQVSKRAAT